MNSLEYALSFVLEHEGGYVNDPDDPGGETNFGICARAYPDVDIAALTRAGAKEIYRRDYWHAQNCDQMPAHVALVMFDTAVNLGLRAAGRLLQRSINAQFIDGEVVPSLVVDGVIGTRTLGTMDFYVGSSRTRSLLLAKDVLLNRMDHYRGICRERSASMKYLLGWTRRVTELNRRLQEV